MTLVGAGFEAEVGVERARRSEGKTTRFTHPLLVHHLFGVHLAMTCVAEVVEVVRPKLCEIEGDEHVFDERCLL